MPDASKSPSFLMIALQTSSIKALKTSLITVILMFVGGVIGIFQAEKTLMHHAAERGYAEYCSAIGDLVWKGECRKEIE